MNKLIVVALVGLLLVSFVSAYYCISPEDNNSVKEFKQKVNVLSLKQDVDSGLNSDTILLKLKYFGPCK